MPDCIFNHINYSWPLNNGELGVLTLPKHKNPQIFNNFICGCMCGSTVYSIMILWVQPTVDHVVL